MTTRINRFRHAQECSSSERVDSRGAIGMKTASRTTLGQWIPDATTNPYMSNEETYRYSTRFKALSLLGWLAIIIGLNGIWYWLFAEVHGLYQGKLEAGEISYMGLWLGYFALWSLPGGFTIYSIRPMLSVFDVISIDDETIRLVRKILRSKAISLKAVKRIHIGLISNRKPKKVVHSDATPHNLAEIPMRRSRTTVRSEDGVAIEFGPSLPNYPKLLERLIRTTNAELVLLK